MTTSRTIVEPPGLEAAATAGGARWHAFLRHDETSGEIRIISPDGLVHRVTIALADGVARIELTVAGRLRAAYERGRRGASAFHLFGESGCEAGGGRVSRDPNWRPDAVLLLGSAQECGISLAEGRNDRVEVVVKVVRGAVVLSISGHVGSPDLVWFDDGGVALRLAGTSQSMRPDATGKLVIGPSAPSRRIVVPEPVSSSAVGGPAPAVEAAYASFVLRMSELGLVPGAGALRTLWEMSTTRHRTA